MATKTAQEIFNEVAEALLRQNQRSTTAENNQACAYRGHHGLKCAVGFLITDEEYDPVIEGQAVPADSDWEEWIAVGREAFARRFSVGKARMMEVMGRLDLRGHGRLLRKLQEVHDCSSVDYWASGLINVARLMELDDAVVYAVTGEQARERLREEE